MGKSQTPPPQAAHRGTRHTALQLGDSRESCGSWVGLSAPCPALCTHTGRALGTEAQELPSVWDGGVLAMPEG